MNRLVNTPSFYALWLDLAYYKRRLPSHAQHDSVVNIHQMSAIVWLFAVRVPHVSYLGIPVASGGSN